jgi:hypothetical protein
MLLGQAASVAGGRCHSSGIGGREGQQPDRQLNTRQCETECVGLGVAFGSILEVHSSSLGRVPSSLCNSISSFLFLYNFISLASLPPPAVPFLFLLVPHLHLFFFFFYILSGVRLSPLGTAATTGLLYQPQMIDDGDCGAIGGMKLGRGNRSTRRNPAPAPLCPPQIPLDQTRD